MAKYLVRANLTAEGLKGTLKEGGTARREAVKKAVESMGGTSSPSTTPLVRKTLWA